MSILIDENTNFIVQGLTGYSASVDTKFCLDYGTKIIAGVVPGRGSEEVHGIPVYETIRSAQKSHPIDATVIYVPPAGVKNAAFEAIDANLKLMVIITEGVPLHDFVQIFARAKASGTRIIGPNTAGIISPGKSKIGLIGNTFWIFKRGGIGILSVSGGMTIEIGWMANMAGLGVSTALSMGGDPMLGSSYKDLLKLYEKDEETKAVVMFCEPGGRYDSEVVELVKAKGFTKPLVVFIGGWFMENMPMGMSFGHAYTMIEQNTDKPSYKERVFKEAEIPVVRKITDIIPIIEKSI